MRLALLICLALISSFTSIQAQPRAKKVVFLAGKKSHGPGDHEYEKACRLLAACLSQSPNAKGFRAEVHLYGWPEDPKALDDADCIVLYSDGSDHNVADHPLLIGDRLKVIDRQMKRGCGLVLLHYATFAGVNQGGKEYLDWVGGFFDYETGSAPNHWRSAIKFCEAKPMPATPSHPICRGVAPFDLREEYYYKMRFADGDKRRKAILDVDIPGEPERQTIAWAVERADRGRGFSFTGGHPYANYLNDNVRRVLLNAIVWAAKGSIPVGGVQSSVPADVDELKVLVLTGHHHPAHDWKATTPLIQQLLERDSRIRITVWEDPEKLASSELDRFHVIVQNYQNWEKPTLGAAAKANLLRWVRAGGGLALVHFANGAWRDWPEYSGGLSRRVWIDGKANHDAYGPFKVKVANPNHLLAQGLQDFDTVDELYCSQVGDKPIEPFLTAKSKITGNDEPLAYTYTEGKGRIFQLLLGHGVESLRTPAVSEVLRRSVAWCGGREVLPLPLGPVSQANPAPQKPQPTAGGGPIKLAEGKFGKALDVRGAVIVASKPADFEPPMTVECWVKLNSRSSYNLLVANHRKESPKHWEVFSDAGSGNFCAYLPGYSPSRVDSSTNIADGVWHAVAMQFHANRALLFVDGKLVKDAPLTKNLVRGETPPGMEGQLQFGGYSAGGLGCDGLIDEVRISNYARTISGVPMGPFTLDRDTLGLWRFDAVTSNSLADEAAPSNGAVALRDAAPIAVQGGLIKRGAWAPRFDKSTSVEWPSVGNDKGGARNSPLRQIHRGNVKALRPAWTYSSGDADLNGNSTLECTPIMVEGMLYLTTVKLNVVALDAATGKEIWRFDPKSGGVNRGVAYWTDGAKRRILVAFQNAQLISLDARTGEPDPQFGNSGVVDLRQGFDFDMSRFGYGSSSAPAIYKDTVILGFLSSEVGPGAPGDVRAFDVRTGKEVWRFRTVPRPGEFGHDTWPPDAWKMRGGANAWGGCTVDEKNGIVFTSTGSAASDFYGGDRIGNNLFANCTLALDARTGQRLWHFQTLHHDIWDRDNPTPPILCSVKREGKTIDAVAQVTKTGFCFLFERKTGKPIYEIKEVPVPASDVPGEQAATTQPEPVKPPPFVRQTFTEQDATDISPESRAFVLEKLKGYRHGGAYEPPSLRGSVINPGFHGGATWSGASFDATSGLLYVNSNNTPWVATLRPDPTLGYNFTGYNYFNDALGYPAIKPPWGVLTAIDLSKGTFAWQTVLGEVPELMAKGVPQTGTENFGGTLVTAGGLVFIAGTKDEKFRAFDAASGRVLWEAKLPAGGYATPCTYSINGKQYVVIACGGGGKLKTKSGDSYVAFALP